MPNRQINVEVQIPEIEVNKYGEMVKVQLRNGNFDAARRIINIAEFNSRDSDERNHDVNNIPVHELDMCKRIVERLEDAEIFTIQELVDKYYRLTNIRGIGPTSIAIIVAALRKYGVKI